MSKKQTLYDVLGVSANTQDRDIKKAYQNLALQYHPDKNPEGKEKFAEINEAYSILQEKDKREIYDQLLKVPSQELDKLVKTGGSIGQVVDVLSSDNSLQEELSKPKNYEKKSVSKESLGEKFQKEAQIKNTELYRRVVSKHEAGTLTKDLNRLLEKDPRKYREIITNTIIQSSTGMSKELDPEGHERVFNEVMSVYNSNHGKIGSNLTVTEWDRIKPHINNLRTITKGEKQKNNLNNAKDILQEAYHKKIIPTTPKAKTIKPLKSIDDFSLPPKKGQESKKRTELKSKKRQKASRNTVNDLRSSEVPSGTPVKPKATPKVSILGKVKGFFSKKNKKSGRGY